MGNSQPEEVPLARRLGVFDATMIVMGGIIGAGIFVNPAVVARNVHTPVLIIGAWLIGGAIALIGAFVYAELAALRPRVGGQYAYLRDAYHPIVAFLYGWTLLLVVQTGGMAGAAIIFGRYLDELFGMTIPEQAVAALALAGLTLINCLGVRAGSNVQSALMLTKLIAIALLIAVGAFGPIATRLTEMNATVDSGGLAGLGRGMAPVLFAYGGWQTASFVSGEMRNPRRDLPRGLLIGVIGVIVCYVLVSYSCLRVLGQAGLARTNVPASQVMRHALGQRGAHIIAAGIAVSTLGFLSQSILTAPRVYYAMARDGIFFKAVGYLDPRTQAPTVAIVLQGVCAAAIAFTGKYDQILNYVVAIDVLFFGLTGASLIIFRARLLECGSGLSAATAEEKMHLRVPFHPVTTALFVLACWAICISTVIQFPTNAGIGVGILAGGAVVYPLWRHRAEAL
jgi:basic amino acid/polyamine antiporter, APA family